jgi:hypothetical protein
MYKMREGGDAIKSPRAMSWDCHELRQANLPFVSLASCPCRKHLGWSRSRPHHLDINFQKSHFLVVLNPQGKEH